MGRYLPTYGTVPVPFCSSVRAPHRKKCNGCHSTEITTSIFCMVPGRQLPIRINSPPKVWQAPSGNPTVTCLIINQMQYLGGTGTATLAFFSSFFISRHLVLISRFARYQGIISTTFYSKFSKKKIFLDAFLHNLAIFIFKAVTDQCYPIR